MTTTVSLVNICHLVWLQIFFLVMRTFTITLLTTFKYAIEYYYSHHAVPYIPRTYLFHNWKLFVPFDPPPISTVWITTHCGKSLRDGNSRPHLLSSWEICAQVREQQLEPDMEQWAGSKSGKEYVKDVYCHTAYLTYMQST